jgi:hypothetical protein
MAILREELGDLQAGGQVEDVGRSGVVAAAIGSDERRVPADGDGVAEEGVVLPIRSKELGDLQAGGQVEDVGRSGVQASVVISRTDERCVAADGHGPAEPVVLLTIRGKELGVLGGLSTGSCGKGHEEHRCDDDLGSGGKEEVGRVGPNGNHR